MRTLGPALLLAGFIAFYHPRPVHAADRTELWSASQHATPPAPTIQVYSRETVVDVTVTDKDGNPVHGLTRDDFTVKEDGKPQPIKSFEEFGAQSNPPQQHPKLPPHVYTNLEPSPGTNALNILLLDGLNTAPTDATSGDEVGWSFSVQTRVKKAALEYLQNMPLGTRVAIFDLSRSLRVLQGTSSDPTLFRAAVETMDINMDGRAATPAEWCQQQDVRNRMTLEALGQISASVMGIKGKKNLIWFSAGFPTITDPNINRMPLCQVVTPRTPPPTMGIEDQTAALQKVYGLHTAAQIAVYPIAAHALLPVENDIGVGLLQEPTSKSALDDHLSLESMAEATGGTAYYNTNDLAGAVAKAVQSGSYYYTLSYVPPGEKYDWSHHTIKIAVNQPGLHLAYRKSYDAVNPASIKPAPGLTLAAALAPDPATPIDMRTEMARSMPTSQQVLFDVQVEPSNLPAEPSDPSVFGMLDAKLKDKPLTRYGFSYALPGRQIVLKPAADGKQHGSLEFDLAAYDGDGQVVTSLRQAIDLNLTADQGAQLAHSPFRYFQQLDLPPGALFVRIGVFDRTANKVGTLEIPLTVAKPVHTAEK